MEVQHETGDNPSTGRAGAIEPNLATSVFAAVPAAIYTVDSDGWITSYNPGAAELWGRHPRLGADRWSGAWRLFRPDGVALPHEAGPMAVALRDRRSMRDVEAVAERPDGVRIPFLANPTLLWNRSGDIVGAVNFLVDVTGWRREALAELHLASIVESSHDAIISKDINSIIATWNAGAEHLFGYTAAEAVGQHINLLIPDERCDEEPKIIERIRRGEKVDHFETVRRRKDGSLVDISLTISPVRDEQGRIVGASKIARDISERRHAEEQQRLILREMSHRIKNLFSVAASLVTISARTASTPEEVALSVRARLNALTRAQELTRPGMLDIETPKNEATLAQLLETILEPYRLVNGSGHASVCLTGQEVLLGGSAITSLALIFHELATNAAKYGALSVPAGAVSVGWRVANGRLVVGWQERGGPTVSGPPVHVGFGRTLTERLIVGQFSGSLDHRWESEGLSINIDVAADKLGWVGPG